MADTDQKKSSDRSERDSYGIAEEAIFERLTMRYPAVTFSGCRSSKFYEPK
jgi:hypothetical protein